MAKARSIYVCFYKDNEGATIGHATSPRNDFSKEIPKQIDHEIREEFIGEIFDNFCKSMLGYIDMLPFIAGLGGAITWGIRNDELKNFCEDKSSSKLIEEKRDIYELEGSDISNFIAIDDRARTGDLVGKQVPKMLIIGVVSSLDHHISQLIRVILKNNPGLISDSEKKINVKDVFKAESIEEFKNQMLDREIETVTRESLDEQIKWFQKTLGLAKPIQDDYPKWASLIEIIERRNLFAHANGIVNGKYIKNVTEASGGSSPKVKIGDELYATRKYFKATLENITEFGIKLSQVIWRKINQEESLEADDQLGDIGFSLIERGEYQLAISVLEFALYTLKGKKDERRRRMNVVNLASAHNLLGNSDKVEEVLSTENWDIVSDDFAISVAAVKGDMKSVYKYMKRLSSSGDWDGVFLEEWPVFFKIREERAFKEEFKKVFGREYVPQAKDRHKVLENFLATARKQARTPLVDGNMKTIELAPKVSKAVPDNKGAKRRGKRREAA